MRHTLGGTPNANDWYNAPVVINWACTETGSGLVEACAQETFGTEGSTARTLVVHDLAGHEGPEVGGEWWMQDTTRHEQPPGLLTVLPANGESSPECEPVTMDGNV